MCLYMCRVSDDVEAKEVELEGERREQAAMRLQTVWRGVCGRRRVAVLREQKTLRNIAATTIQVNHINLVASPSLVPILPS